MKGKWVMNPQLVLLLTQDARLQLSLTQTPACADATVLLAHELGDALGVVCSHGKELDLAVIDFDDGCHGMTLLNAIHMCCPEVPLVAIVPASGDIYHAAALAYANGATACLTKPVSSSDLEIVVDELSKAKQQLQVV
jgi:DNA-binding NtrC family response regulator